MDQLTSMRVFALTAQAGTLSGAARILDMSPAMATKHVGALEARLGVKLLHRTTRKLVLTEAGQAYLEAVQRILAELDEADAAATSQRTQVTGLLRLNAPYAFGLRHLAPLMPLARQTHPAVWITGLTLQGSDDAIEIRGRMTDPAVLPDYLRSLQSEPRFKGRAFATLQIRPGGSGSPATDGLELEPASQPNYSEFTLSSQAPRTEPAKP